MNILSSFFPVTKAPSARRRLMALLLLGFAAFWGRNANAQSSYCTSGLNGASYAWIDSVSIVNTTLQSSSGMAPTYYNLFPASGSTTATLTLGQTYTLYVRTENTSSTPGGIVSAWIDFNQDFTFSASEWVQVNTSGLTGTVSITVPTAAVSGTTRMRIRSRGTGNTNGSGDACISMGSGETEDYTITIQSGTPCTGTPAGGTTTASSSTPCPGSIVNLSVTGSAINSGLTYQWLQLVSGVWTPITGATSFNYATPALAGGTYSYRRKVTCTASAGTDTSAAVTVTVGNTALPYLETFESITANNTLPACMGATNLSTYVYTYTANQTSYNRTNHTPGGSKFASFRYGADDYVFTPGFTLQTGKTYRVKFWYITDGLSGWTSISAKLGTGQTAAAMTTNLVTVSSPTNTTYQSATTTFQVPANGSYNIGINVIGTFSPWYVSIDDIELIELPVCSGKPVAGTIASDPVNPCLGKTAKLGVTGSTQASGITYQWQLFNPLTSAWANVAGANVDNYTTPVLTDSSRYRLIATCTSAGGSADTTAPYLLNPYGVTLPYLETFEGITANNQLPDCWAATNLNSYVYTYTTNQTSYNRINHTPNGSKFASFRYGANDWLFSRGFALQTGKTYRVKYWYITDGLNGWTSISASLGTGQTAAAMTTNLITISNPTNTTYQSAIATFQVPANGTYNLGINVVGTFSPWYVSVDDIELVELPPCSGKPVAGTIVPDPSIPCLGTTAKLSLTGSTQASGLTYQWQNYNNVTAAWVTIAGATLDNLTTPPINDSIRYRLILTCGNAGGGADTTAPITLNPFSVTLPLLQTFESITANNQLPNCWTATNLNSSVLTYTTNQTSYNRINRTPGGSKFASFRYGGDDWIFSPGIRLDTGKTYQMRYWYITDGLSGWNLLRAAYGTTANAGAMTNTIATVNAPNSVTYQQSKGNFTVGAPGVYNIGINCQSGFAPWYLSVDDIGLVELPPCSGKPMLTMAQGDTVSICPDTTAFATLRGSAGDFSGLQYQWDSSTNGTTWFPIVSANGEEYIAYSSALYPKIYYRQRVTCVNSGSSDTGRVTLKITPPIYAPIPYFNGFETWENSCAINDVPSGGNWRQYWFTGNASWRRDDQGATANWQAPTSGAYTPVAQSGARSARFHTNNAIGFSPAFGYGEGQLDMYLNCSSSLPAKGLYFYMMNKYSNNYRNDSLTIWYSIDGGLQFNQLDGWDTATNWTRRVVNIPSNSPATIVSFRARKFGSYDYTDIGIDSVYVAEPCNGTPVAGIISIGGSTAICAGSSASFVLNGTSMAGNILVQWEASTTSSTTGFTAISGAGTQYNFTTPAVTANTWYRARVTCGGSGLFTYSNVIAVTTTPAVYATLPYVEDFESWTTRCNTSDIPSVNWTNAPATGNQSWRRFDQGSTASWTGATTGGFFPASAIGNYSARFHNYYAPDNSSGRLDLYVDCSGAGNKELRYYINMNNRSGTNTDFTRVSYSMNGGVTFSNLTLTPITGTTGWEQKIHVVPSNSATTLIRFETNAQQYLSDIAIDYVEVLPACTGKPTAGVIDSVRPCTGSAFQLKATGTSLQGGLTYQWQSTTAATATGFTNPAVGGTAALYNTAITQPTWYRLIVTCANSNQSDTTAPFRAQLGSFYNCYCAALPYYPYTFSATLNVNIGNVTLTTQPANTVLLNNGAGTPLTNNTTSTNPSNPGYSSFTNLPATPIYLDSVYKLAVQQVSASASNTTTSTVAAWIDYNQDGVFDQIDERVVSSTVSTTSRQSGANFTVPATAKVGVTAMRVILASSSSPNVCGIYNYYGETEDYLVEVRYHPCAGVVNAGIAMASDLNTCPGYKVTLTDTSYEKQRYGLVRSWQQSTNGGSSWSNIPGSQNRDTFKALVQGPTKFRFALACSVSGVNSYSNVLDVKMNEAYQCYCASYADGGASEKADSSDVGSFSIGNYTFQVGGPHLQNPAAIRERTDYTEDGANVIELFADSTYKIDIYHIMRGRLHRDAKVTLFMDFNNDFQYTPSPVGSNYPSERVLTAFTSAGDYYLDNLEVTIPKGYVIANKLTGMRLILNEAVGASNASDQGCGVYGSGETEDFAVIFRDGTAPQGVGVLSGNVKVLSLYPNPTSGVATLSYSSDVSVRDLELTVTSATGQVILRKTFSDIGRSFSTDLELGEQARGVYFVELKADGERIIRKLVTQ